MFIFECDISAGFPLASICYRANKTLVSSQSATGDIVLNVLLSPFKTMKQHLRLGRSTWFRFENLRIITESKQPRGNPSKMSHVNKSAWFCRMIIDVILFFISLVVLEMYWPVEFSTTLGYVSKGRNPEANLLFLNAQ